MSNNSYLAIITFNPTAVGTFLMTHKYNKVVHRFTGRTSDSLNTYTFERVESSMNPVVYWSISCKEGSEKEQATCSKFYNAV
jgi:hypothetical protein